jgi:hypothetical protein
MKVFFTYGPNPIRDFEKDHLPRMRDEVARAGSVYSVCDDPASADLIVFLESVEEKTRRDAERLRRDPLLAAHPQKCFTINYEDCPPGFLPGVYLSLPRQRFHPERHRSWGCVVGEPYHILKYRERRTTHRPRLLFSFRGALSHAVRRNLVEHSGRFPRGAHEFSVKILDRWLNYSGAEEDDYAGEILDSWFVLCPRGIGCGTHRMFEVMSLGRCPVIISDDWVASPNVDWESGCLRIREAELPGLVERLERELPRAEALGRGANELWEKHFAPEVRAVATLDQLRDLARARPATHDEGAQIARWQSREFRRANGWLLSQRASERLRAGARGAWKRVAPRRMRALLRPLLRKLRLAGR